MNYKNISDERKNILVELTNHCNFLCVLCPHSHYGKETPGGNRFDRKKGYIGRELFDIAIVEAEKHARILNFSFFGEPMLHPDFSKLISSIPRERPYDVTLNTNWSLFTPDKHLEALMNLDFVHVSLDTTDPERYDELCPGSNVVTWEGRNCPKRLATIEDKLERWLSLDERPPTRIVVVKSSRNRNDEVMLLEKWRPHLRGKDHILLKSVISYGGCIADETTSAHPCDIYEKHPWVTIAWDGLVSPCDLDVNMAMNAGSLLETPYLSNIMQSNKWAATLDRIRERQGICANCFDANNWRDVEVYYRE